MPYALSDPTFSPRRWSWFDRLGLRLINDPRDLPFVGLTLRLAMIAWPGALLLFWHFNWWFAAFYLGVVFGWYTPPFILMLHNTSHRRFFRRNYHWLNWFIPWLVGPFYGETPETYFAHHIGMHHPENNLPDDLSSTMAYRRDSLIDFGRYFFRFLFVGIFELSFYLYQKKRLNLLFRCLAGELGFWLLAALLCQWNWRATLVVFILPVLLTRFGMLAGNWGQHAFVGAADPASPYLNSITCINTIYNRRCFNDGYHIGHHVKATRHWTEMPTDLSANEEKYLEAGAIIFEGIDFFGVWALLMIKRYDWLARRVSYLGRPRPSEAAIVALLKSRTQPILATNQALEAIAVA